VCAAYSLLVTTGVLGALRERTGGLEDAAPTKFREFYFQALG